MDSLVTLDVDVEAELAAKYKVRSPPLSLPLSSSIVGSFLSLLIISLLA